MGGTPDQRARSEDVAGQQQRQVVLAEVQDVGPGGPGDVGAVVHREQGTVPARRVGEDLERRKLVARLQRPEALLARSSPCRAAG